MRNGAVTILTVGRYLMHHPAHAGRGHSRRDHLHRPQVVEPSDGMTAPRWRRTVRAMLVIVGSSRSTITVTVALSVRVIVPGGSPSRPCAGTIVETGTFNRSLRSPCVGSSGSWCATLVPDNRRDGRTDCHHHHQRHERVDLSPRSCSTSLSRMVANGRNGDVANVNRDNCIGSCTGRGRPCGDDTVNRRIVRGGGQVRTQVIVHGRAILGTSWAGRIA
jgi:hypothetical protein